MKSEILEAKGKALNPLRQATLVFLVKENQILLAMKRRGFGVNLWNGVGGKITDGESVENAAKREANEEIGINLLSINKVATLNFYFSDKPDWNQQVVVYLSDSWNGTPKESEEMSPKWFDINEIPYDKMWDDDIHWLPDVLKGINIEADFLFNEEQKMIEKDVRKITLR
ncbi:MAG: NUDIX hydrolase [Microgenomates group bacterium GW2011_GWC1_41_20]|uniref:Oxidized purine nucleoside triphosphate hydrolase n=6 Tax=Candidatus Woeseibacteriota TaxID=1752722 RepID=A0A0G0RTP8_9BACT|nr:MAG: NUDIX hydrolase [Candidatus Woesebacteria bacterium GW2011_GWB1_40_12]KKR55903.1 MAG: NUDIX hydrolase [Candidatus Woesebacteria bacterium GW2011_GWF1_40_24]KKR90884.1 MAG: NUDIX hydrolase [Candidatus Woesebacteria bacterium GW2011_GWD1_41_12]KKS00508.1 MAG: NUDIX hydrolase [Microgenomates group bacterium GW2011_GWC1_41_20]KKS05624.1 MAG: NUDIX hydrolase [Candidatus Woesebacteria bacterium GW2011_GWE1_41_24]KKS17949.1 MAG: NUDIX hydrolase [Candidatus Woesebacteria bacterium GW2011_GWA1_